MSDKDYAKYVWELYEEAMASRNDADYEPNPEQMKKLIEGFTFFMEMAVSCHGTVEPLSLVPKKESCGITAYFRVFNLIGDDLKRFCEIVQGFSAMSIDSLVDGTVCLSFTVPKVFRKK